MDRKAQIPTFIVDAFTAGENEFCTGNTAAIFLLEYDNDISDEMKQKIASEMNVSITVFASRYGWSKTARLDLDDAWAIRWFSVACEIRLCGHGTLAASKILFNRMERVDNNDPESRIKLESKSAGRLGTTICWATNLITLDFPLNTTVALSREEPWVKKLISSTLGPQIHPNQLMDVQLCTKMNTLSIYLQENLDSGTVLIRNNAEAIIKNVKPNWSEMLELGTVAGSQVVDGVLVSIRGHRTNEGPHYFVRVFFPWKGINEDPVCGFAQTIVGPYWKKQLEKDGFHVKKLLAKQMSERGGDIIVTLEGDRVNLTGSTRTVFSGEFIVPECQE